MITERAVRRQIRATTSAMNGAHGIDATVRDVQDRHGLGEGPGAGRAGAEAALTRLFARLDAPIQAMGTN